MIELANKLKVNPWFNMPHEADDEYVWYFATTVRDRLDPNLKVHLEYSNETWNAQFQQTHYVGERGLALGLDTDRFKAGLQYHAKRAKEIFRIWEAVFSGKARLVRIFASQAGNPWVSEQILTTACRTDEVDALAIAPYFGGEFGDPSEAARVQNMNVEQLFAELRERIMSDDPNAYPQREAANLWMMKAAKAEADKCQVKLVAYEGGQHLVGVNGQENNENLTRKFITINRDPRIEGLYAQYLNNWSNVGGGVFMNFTDVTPYMKWGSWGALEYQDQNLTAAPKYRALVTFANQRR